MPPLNLTRRKEAAPEDDPAPRKDAAPKESAPEGAPPARKKGGLFAGRKPAASSEPKPERKRSKPHFIRGGEAHDELTRAQRRSDERAERRGSTRRFWIDKKGGQRRITFLDGELSGDSILDIPYFYDHTVPYEGGFENFRCTMKAHGECPLCDEGDSAMYVGVLTVLEHHEEPWEDRDGNEHHYSRRLYVAKLKTLKILNMLASNYDGLTGATFDVMRANERDARVGSSFNFVQKDSIDDLASQLDEPEHAEPANYEEEPELAFRTPEELRELGFGAKVQRRSVGRRRARNRDLGDELG